MPKNIFQQVIRVSGLILLLAVLAQSAFALELPPTGSAAFLQTSGPVAGLGIGDYYTSDDGEPIAANRFHRMEIYVPCAWPADTPLTFALYDPESSDPDPVPPAPPANDEVRGTPNNTTYTLTAPGGATIAGPRTFLSAGGTNGLWVELLTFEPGDPGFPCGTYVLTNTTDGGNDDNAWRLRVSRDPDCTVTPGTCTAVGAATSALMSNGNEANDFDGANGTGDELVAGLTRTSYQHNGASCQNFYQFVDGISPTVTFNNFDLDVPNLPATITYFPPDGSTIAGTPSGVASWNGSPDNSAENPNPPRTGDTIAITPALIGWWRFEVCVGATDNQYIFEGLEGEPVFFEPVPFPNMTISKDDALTTVSSSGQTVTYTIQYANTGNGAALAATITDTLPTGATFVSCTGGCTGVGPVTWNLGVVPAAGNAGSSGSITITMQLPPAAAGATHTNSVEIDHTDLIGNNYPPVTATDVDTVVGPPTSPTLTISKDDALTTVSSSGQTVTYTIQYANTGTGDAINAVITDTLPTGATFVSCTGGCSGAGPVTWTLGTVPTGGSGSVTITMQLPPAAAGATHTNSVSISYTDGVGGNYPPVTATDVDTVVGVVGPIPTNTPVPAGTAVAGAGGTPSTSSTAAPSTAGITATATFVFVDPFITKRVEPLFSLPGEIVTWTIVVKNPGTASISNVVVTDTLPAQVALLGTIPSSSAIKVSGQTVTFTQALLAPGEEVTFQVRARVRGDINLSRLTNRACVDFAQSTSDHCASASVSIVSQLPSTGESPWSPWRLPVVLMVVGGVVAGLAFAYRGMRG